MKDSLPINHIDSRGYIRDIFVNNPKDHCSIISFAKGAKRANHYHKESTQYTYVIQGKIFHRYGKVNDRGEITGKIEEEWLVEGDIITHQPFVAHAFIAEESSLILAFADGLRGGVDYEADVYRLESPLI